MIQSATRIGLLAIGVMIYIGACTPNKETNPNRPSNLQERDMQFTNDNDFSTVDEIPAIDAAAPEVLETASFGLGWFWGPDSRFGIVDGVVRTRVGYAGGDMKDPNYRHLGDHTETLQIDYDPQRISYSDLLDIFWKSHKPTGRSWKRQYMNAVFYHDDQQRLAALASKKAIEANIGGEVRTEILPVKTFYRAEDYHQKYLLNRRSEFARELARIYPRKKDFVDSTAVTRLNGYVGGYGSSEQLKREIDQLGLSAESRQALLDLVGRKGTGWFN